MADATIAASTPSAAAVKPPGLREYSAVMTFFALYGFGLALATGAREHLGRDALIAPMGGMAAITFVVWLLMLVFRNGAIIRGNISGAYYVDYRSDVPPDWIERPARTFNNLMQVPSLFYVVCLALMVTERVDLAALRLAWMFVIVRAVHALVYMAWNYVPLRFAMWVASFMTLTVMWWRFVVI
jgi:hypothetical protein